MFLVPECLKNFSGEYEDAILTFYKDDQPNPSSFQQEVRLLNRHWSKTQDLPNSISETLKRISSDNIEPLFSNITRILSILLTSAATSATVERANSALRYVKTDFRSMMSEERFNARRVHSYYYGSVDFTDRRDLIMSATMVGRRRKVLNLNRLKQLYSYFSYFVI